MIITVANVIGADLSQEVFWGPLIEVADQLARLIAQIVVDRRPEIATIERSLRARQGRVYLDFVQNGHGRLLIAPFSARPFAGAPASSPLRWSEVNDSLDPAAFTIETLPGRMADLGDDPLAAVLEIRPNLVAALERLAEML